ncbi:tetratricopeptide repeat protein [Sagittula sp. MA-2]|jgi:tetratricopeptide (TPR) repeat protein|uniref:tetratricopeptide repeat protein n=1 Tax=Sagittula sp. MA-2 TaxID=3048007 RepID=UPI0024C342EA|nr:tetratricopeptide repeat protein [Sagittula sp. MA-2]WHZ36550.1 tetratricopeptide repeat protein [Sagittula sp. MA-2]
MVDLTPLPALLATEDWPEAERLLRSAAAEEEATAPVCYNLAKVLEKQEKHATREDWLRRALARDPAHGKAWFELGRLRLAADNLEEAEAAFSRAAEHMPQDMESWRMVMRVRLRLGLWDGVRDALMYLPSDAETRSVARSVAAEIQRQTRGLCRPTVQPRPA